MITLVAEWNILLDDKMRTESIAENTGQPQVECLDDHRDDFNAGEHLYVGKGIGRIHTSGNKDHYVLLFNH